MRAFVSVGAVFALAAIGSAQPAYHAVVIGPPDGFDFVSPTAMTPDGVIVGSCAPTLDEYPIFGVRATAPGGAEALESEEIPSIAWAVSPDGEIIGGFSGFRPCVWIDGQFRWLEQWIDGPMPLFGAFGTPLDATDQGLLVGELDTDLPFMLQAVYWPSLDARPRFLPGLVPDISPGRAVAINPSGQVAGTAQTSEFGFEHFAVVWDSVTSAPRVLGTLPGTTYSNALGMNDGGDVVGFAQTPSTGRVEAIFYDGTTEQWVGLGHLPGAVVEYSEAWDVNEARQVVGSSNAGEGVAHGFLWQDGQLHDLNDLVDPIPGVLWISNARAINDAGQIAAEGVVEEGLGFSDRAIVLLTPIECEADVDGDGDADSDDFFGFLDLFVAGDDRADLDGDGDRDADDFFLYLDAFAAGC